ncbi:MAG: carboxymuconolactone decarboxylase family protein [Chloroflexaceae bacterium]|nr:carboxymuconolactone decarboxylase family protein [Chloroflexaceae bacterium]
MKNYPELRRGMQEQVATLREANPKALRAFGQLHHATTQEGAISQVTKELIALGIAIAVRCDACIAAHVHDALKYGATREQLAEAIGVAILMGGGPAAMYGAEAFHALDQFIAERAIETNGVSA